MTLIAFTSCASNLNLQRAKLEEKQGDWDKAVLYYAHALKEHPGDVNIRLNLEKARRMASKGHLAKARDLWEGKQYEDSLIEYRTARELDPLNRTALTEFSERIKDLDKMQEDQRQEEEENRLKQLTETQQDTKEQEKPVIEINGDKKQNFYFPNKPIDEIYQSLAKLAGINIVYHESVRQKIKQRTDFIINNATFWEAFDYFVTTNDHFYRVLNDDTILIIDGSRNNRSNYEDKAIKVFYLSNAEVRDVFTALRTVVPQGMRISMIRPQNAIVVRDTPQKIAIVAKLIDILDKPKAEVIIDVEFLEVDSSILNDIGVLLSSYAVSQSFVNPNTTADGARNVINMNDFSLINKSNLFLTVPDMVYNFIKTSANSKLLAKPQLRITEGEKSELHIGERVPVRKSTFNPGSAAGIGTPVDSYDYETTGIKFTMTPRVHNNGEISLEMDIEISAIGAGAGTENPTFTTRNIKSKLRLADGETNLLAGLIREEEKYDRTGVAGLSDIPVIGKLFSRNTMKEVNTDIIITITPHIVRGGRISSDELMAIKAGPDVNPGYEGLISMANLENIRFLRGIPIAGLSSGRGGNANYDDNSDEDYYYDEDEDYSDEEGNDNDEEGGQ